MFKSEHDGLFKIIGMFLYNQASSWAGNVMNFVISFFMMVIVIFFLLIDHEKFITYVLELSPLPDSQERQLINRFQDIAKAVLVKDRQGFAMVVIPGSNWVKLQALQEEADRDFELADESDVDELFSDCQPGAIPPLGPAYGMETFLDEQLTSLANVYFEAGDHIHLVQVNGKAFHDLLKGARHGHYSHND